MPKFNLPNGQELHVSVSHGYFDAAHGDFYTQQDVNNARTDWLCRATRVRLYNPQTHVEVEGLSVCKFPDNFSKRLGRKFAATSLLRKLQGWSKDARRQVFQAVCPEYKKS